MTVRSVIGIIIVTLSRNVKDALLAVLAAHLLRKEWIIVIIVHLVVPCMYPPLGMGTFKRYITYMIIDLFYITVQAAFMWVVVQEGKYFSIAFGFRAPKRIPLVHLTRFLYLQL